MTYQTLLEAVRRAEEWQRERERIQLEIDTAEGFTKQRLGWDLSGIDVLMSQEIE